MIKDVIIHKNGRDAGAAVTASSGSGRSFDTGHYSRIFMGHGVMGNGIAFSANESIGVGGFNENLSIESDAEGIHLRPLGMGIRRSSGKLTFEGGAELYWGMFVDHLRR